MQRWESSTYGSANLLELVSLPKPILTDPNHVILRLLATSSTYTDQLILHGNYMPKYPLPVTPGYDAIGIVENIGTAVTNLAIGDRVAIMPQGGCATTHKIIPAKECVRIRTDIPPELTITVILTGITAYQMVHRAAGNRIVQAPQGSLTRYPLHNSVSPSSSTTTNPPSSSSSPSPSTHRFARILVHSCTGATGSMIVQIAKAAGLPPSHIYGTCSGKNISLAKETMDIQAFDYNQSWDIELLKCTNNEGVDVIFDAIILNKYYEKGMKCLREHGKYIGYGVTNTANPGSISIPSVILALTKLSLQNSIYAWFNKKEAEFYNIAERRKVLPTDFDNDMATLLTMVKENTLKPIIGKIWTFAEVKLALLSIENNQSTGRQVIKISDE